MPQQHRSQRPPRPRCVCSYALRGIAPAERQVSSLCEVHFPDLPLAEQERILEQEDATP